MYVEGTPPSRTVILGIVSFVSSYCLLVSGSNRIPCGQGTCVEDEEYCDEFFELCKPCWDICMDASIYKTEEAIKICRDKCPVYYEREMISRAGLSTQVTQSQSKTEYTESHQTHDQNAAHGYSVPGFLLLSSLTVFALIACTLRVR